MTQAQVIEGTPKEIQDHLKTINETTRLTLFVPAESERSEKPINLHHATAEERAQALDEIAKMNKDVPVLPAEAYNRESLYEESF